jgi:hypothetical protein
MYRNTQQVTNTTAGSREVEEISTSQKVSVSINEKYNILWIVLHVIYHQSDPINNCSFLMLF